MECLDGDMDNHIMSTGGDFDEDELRSIVCEIANSVCYLHSRGVIHRDLKPKNILMCDGHAKIGDFGLARSVIDDARFSTELGTPYYMAPELHIKGNACYTEAVDVWAIGCIVAEMYIGDPLFELHDPRDKVIQRIIDVIGWPSDDQITDEFPMGLYELLDRVQRPFSQADSVLENVRVELAGVSVPEDALEFIALCLQFDPCNRPTVLELLNHPFLATVSIEPVRISSEAEAKRGVPMSLPLGGSIYETIDMYRCDLLDHMLNRELAEATIEMDLISNTISALGGIKPAQDDMELIDMLLYQLREEMNDNCEPIVDTPLTKADECSVMCDTPPSLRHFVLLSKDEPFCCENSTATTVPSLRHHQYTLLSGDDTFYDHTEIFTQNAPPLKHYTILSGDDTFIM
jgi:prepilin-type processing-associated H-X9-DG protein